MLLCTPAQVIWICTNNSGKCCATPTADSPIRLDQNPPGSQDVSSEAVKITWPRIQIKGTYTPTCLHILLPTQQFHVVELMMSQRTSEITKYLNVTESSFIIQCLGLPKWHQKKWVMKLIVLYFWLPLLGCIRSANVVRWDPACDNKHSETVFYCDSCMIFCSAPA